MSASEEKPEEQWLTTEDARSHDGRRPMAFRNWLSRWNQDPTTKNKIRRRHGLIELNSLKAAWAEDEERFSQAEAKKAARQRLEEMRNRSKQASA